MARSQLLHTIIFFACAISPAQAQTTITTFAGSIYNLQGLPASSHLDYVYALTVDPSDHLVFAMFGPNPAVYRLRPDGNLDRIAGNGTKGFSGDGGPAINAQLNAPNGLAYDRAANLYIADYGNNRIRKVTPDGTISSIAGNGQPGFTGDGGPATKASLNQPEGVAVDDAGEVFIADTFNNALRKIALDGTITTLAGNGQPGYAQPNDPLNGPALNAPTAVAVDRAGTTVYISEFGNGSVRKLQRGKLTRVVDQQFDFPYGLALDASGTLYIAEANQWRTWALSPGGAINLFAVAEFYGPVYSGSRALLPEASFSPAVAVSRAGTVYISAWEYNGGVCCPMPKGGGPMPEAKAGRIFAITGSTVTLAGGGGPRPNAAGQLVDPLDIAAAPGGVFILELGVNSVSHADAQGKLTAVAGNRTIAFRAGSVLQQQATSVPLDAPRAIAVDTAGDVNISDRPGILHVTPSGVISSALGSGFLANHVFADPLGDFLLTDSLTGTIRKIAPDGAVSTIAPGAKFNGPAGLAQDKAGNYYVVDSGNQVVRQIDAKGNVTTLAGTGKAGFAGDGGAAAQAQFNFSTGSALVADGSGALYVADTENHRVRRIAPGGLITTVAGSSVEGYAGDGGPAEKAELSYPYGLTFDAQGNLYISDIGNDRVRKVAGLKFPSTLVANPSKADISITAGSQTLQVFSSAGVIPFQASSASPWLKLDTATGATPGTVAWHVDPTTLSPGVYTGNIGITSGGAENSPLVVPVNLTIAPPPPVFTTLINAASLAGGGVAPSENVILTGASFIGAGDGQPTVSLQDSAGANLAIAAQATASQIQFQIPAAAALGPAALTITRDDGGSAKSAVTVEAFAPGLYSAAGSGSGVALAEVMTVTLDGVQSSSPAYQCDPAGKCSALPIDLGDGPQDVLLVLHGTGIRNAEFVGVQVGGVEVETVSYSPSAAAPGVDDVILRLSQALVGFGEVRIAMTVGNKPANNVTVSFQ